MRVRIAFWWDFPECEFIQQTPKAPCVYFDRCILIFPQQLWSNVHLFIAVFIQDMDLFLNPPFDCDLGRVIHFLNDPILPNMSVPHVGQTKPNLMTFVDLLQYLLPKGEDNLPVEINSPVWQEVARVEAFQAIEFPYLIFHIALMEI